MMAKTSQIQWTDSTWNVARGCKKVDADCKFCYMYRDSMNETRYNPREIKRTKTVFDLPLKLAVPSKIFTSSLTDFFLEEIDEYRNEAWDIIRKCPQHTFQILTKRPERINQCLPEDWGFGWPNVWLGTSIGSQKGFYERYPHIVNVVSLTKFISFEPLYELIDYNVDIQDATSIDWAIIGGESGNENGKYRYRPCKLEWITDLAKELNSYGTNVFIKQLGTHLAKEMGLKDRHGGDMEEWPEELRIREFPGVRKDQFFSII